MLCLSSAYSTSPAPVCILHWQVSLNASCRFVLGCISFGLQDEDVDWQMDTYAACNFQWFLKSGNLVLDYGQVGDAVETGIMHVRGVHERMIDYVHKSYEFDLTAAVV